MCFFMDDERWNRKLTEASGNLKASLAGAD
jgi:hypothetical protein